MMRRLFACGVIGLAGLSSLLGGCFQKGNYPEIPTSEGFAEDPNRPANEQAMIAALQYVGSRWTPGDRMFDPNVEPRGLPYVNYPAVVNLPQGTRKVIYERVAKKVGPQVQPATPETIQQGLPTFHISRVWLRFNKGWVDVMRPMPELGLGADGQPIYQRVTLHMEGGNKPWTVAYARSWNPGDSAPMYYFLPGQDDPNQYAITMRELRQNAATAMGVEPRVYPMTPPPRHEEGVVEGQTLATQPEAQ
jgi:hypothetical protein